LIKAKHLSKRAYEFNALNLNKEVLRVCTMWFLWESNKGSIIYFLQKCTLYKIFMQMKASLCESHLVKNTANVLKLLLHVQITYAIESY